jgi:predicted MFS family arabinose efflux permease
MEKTGFTGYQRIVIFILALTQFSVVLDFMVLSPLGDTMIKSLDLTTTQFGIVVSSYSLSAGVAGFLTAGFADSFDRKKLLLFFYIGFILGTVFCGLSESYYQLVAARIITGLFGGVIGSISMAIVSDLFTLEQRGRVMGFLQMGFGASQVLGIPISLYLAYHWNWQTPFIMIVLLALCIWAIIIFKIKPIKDHLAVKKEKSALQHLTHTLKTKDYRVGFVASALLSLGGFLIMPWGSAYAINNLNVSEEQLPFMFMLAGISTLIIMPFIGKLSDKIDKFKLMWMSTVWMVTIVMIYTNLSPVPFWIVVTLNVTMMMGVMARMVPAMALITSLPVMQDRGAFMSINSSLQYVSGGIAAGIGGMIVHQRTKTSPIENFNILGLVMVFVAIACIIMVWRVKQIIQKKQNLQTKQ